MSKRILKVTDAELTKHFEFVLFEEAEGKETLNEDFTGAEKEQIRSIIRDFLGMTRSDSFETTVKKMVKDYVKTDKDLDKHYVEISKNVLVQLYKSLWSKRGYWVNDLKNVSN